MNRPCPLSAWLLGLLVGTVGSSVIGQARSIEALREDGRRQVALMRERFDERFAQAIAILENTTRRRDSDAAAEARKDLVQWASAFAPRFATVMAQTQNPDLFAHLLEVLARSDSAEAGSALLGLLGAAPERNLIIVEALGGMGSVGQDVRTHLLTLTADVTVPAALRGEALLAAARLGEPGSAETARRVLGEMAPPGLIPKAIDALSHVSSDHREDEKLIRGALKTSTDRAIHVAVIGALARLEPSSEGRRVLHDALESSDPVVLQAALDALDKVAHRDLSKKPLLELVKQDSAPEEMRARAARLLSRLGSNAGARHLMVGLRKVAEDEKNRFQPQWDVANGFYQLEDWEDALFFFERALSRASAGRRYEVRAWMARCRARLGQFDRASRELKEAGYDTYEAFVDDEAFSAMRADPRWAALFGLGGD